MALETFTDQAKIKDLADIQNDLLKIARNYYHRNPANKIQSASERIEVLRRVLSEFQDSNKDRERSTDAELLMHSPSFQKNVIADAQLGRYAAQSFSKEAKQGLKEAQVTLKAESSLHHQLMAMTTPSRFLAERDKSELLHYAAKWGLNNSSNIGMLQSKGSETQILEELKHYMSPNLTLRAVKTAEVMERHRAEVSANPDQKASFLSRADALANLSKLDRLPETDRKDLIKTIDNLKNLEFQRMVKHTPSDELIKVALGAANKKEIYHAAIKQKEEGMSKLMKFATSAADKLVNALLPNYNNEYRQQVAVSQNVVSNIHLQNHTKPQVGYAIT